MSGAVSESSRRRPRNARAHNPSTCKESLATDHSCDAGTSERVSTPCPRNVHPFCSGYQSVTHVRVLENRRFCNVSGVDISYFAPECSRTGFHSPSSLDRRLPSPRFISALLRHSRRRPLPFLGFTSSLVPCSVVLLPPYHDAHAGRVPLLFLHLRRLAGSRLVDVECPRARFGSEFEDAHAVERQNACTGVDIPSVPGALPLHDGTVAKGCRPLSARYWFPVVRSCASAR